jgi:hypothetical protein
LYAVHRRQVSLQQGDFLTLFDTVDAIYHGDAVTLFNKGLAHQATYTTCTTGDRDVLVIK